MISGIRKRHPDSSWLKQYWNLLFYIEENTEKQQAKSLIKWGLQLHVFIILLAPFFLLVVFDLRLASFMIDRWLQEALAAAHILVLE